MKYQRKGWSLLFIVMLVVSTVLGCSNGSSNVVDTKEPKVEQSENQAKVESEEAGESNKKLSEEPVTVKIMMREHSAQPVLLDSPAIQEIFNKTNVKIELQPVPQSNYTEKSRALIATNNIPDVIWLSTHSEIFEFADTGLFLPISDYMEHAPNFSKIVEDNPEFNNFKVDGKLYGFPVMGKWRIQNGSVPLVRTDVLEKLSLSVPTSYDELFEVATKMKEAYPDSYPLTFRNGTSSILSYMSFNLGSGYTIYYEPDQNKYIYGPASSDFEPVLAYLNKMYEAKLLDPDYAVNTGQTWQEKLSSGKSFMYIDNNTFAVNFNKALQANDSNAKFDQIPILSNNKGQTRSYKYSPHWWETYAISSKTKNPEIVIKLMDWLYSEEGVLVTNFGVEGQHYTMVNGEPKVLASVIDEYKDKQDPLRAIQSALGTGYLSFATYIDHHPNVEVSPPELVVWSDLIAREEGHYVRPIDPPFTEEETNQLKKLKTQVDTLVEQEMDKFIMGVRPLSEYNEFAKKLQEEGALEIEQIYNTAYARVK